MRAIVQSHLPPFPPSKGVHYCGRGFVLLKLTSHKVHSGGHVLKKAVVPYHVLKSARNLFIHHIVEDIKKRFNYDDTK